MTQKDRNNLWLTLGIIFVVLFFVYLIGHSYCWNWWPFSRGCAVTVPQILHN